MFGFSCEMCRSKLAPGGSFFMVFPFVAVINYFLGHNLTLGLRAEAEDVGRNADLRSLVAPPKGGPADCNI